MSVLGGNEAFTAKVPILTQEDLAAMLSRTSKNHDNFVLKGEPRSGDPPKPGTARMIRVMTGNLITLSRLNGLKGRVSLYEDEEARIKTFYNGDSTSPPKK